MLKNIPLYGQNTFCLSAHQPRDICAVPASVVVAVVQLLSHVQLCDPINCSTPGFPVLHHLLGFTQGDAIWPSHSLLPTSPPAFSLSTIRVFSSELALRIKRPKYWSFSFSINPSSEYSVLIPLQDWLVWSPCCPRNSQESSLTPQFRSINSSALSLLYGPTLASKHDYWKSHSSD